MATSSQPAAPSSRWSVIVAFSLVGAATQMVWLTFAPVTSVAADHYGVPVSAIGWLANVFVLCFVLLAIPAGLLLDRWLRATLAVGAALTAAGAVLRVAGDQYHWLLVGGLVAALGQPVMLTGITGLSRGYLRAEHRASGIAIATASTWAGFIAAFALGTVFSTAGAMATLVRVHAVYATVAAVVLCLVLRTPAPHEEARPATSVADSLRDLRTVGRDPMIRRLCALGFITFGTFISLTTWTEALLKPAGVSVDQVGVALIVNIVAGVAGTAVLPVWVSRHRREVRLGLVGVAVTAAGCALLAVSPGFGAAVVALGLAGLLLLPMLAIVLEIIERQAGETEGAASGLVWAMGNLGGLVVSGLIGFTVDAPELSFLLMAAVTLLAVPVLAGLRAPIAALPAQHADVPAPRQLPLTSADS